MTENPLNFGEVVGDHQVITRGGRVEAVVVPLEEYQALEQREAELYWAVHEAQYPSRPGDDVPEGKVYESMDALRERTPALCPAEGIAHPPDRLELLDDLELRLT
jgi:hypothetical protein